MRYVVATIVVVVLLWLAIPAETIELLRAIVGGIGDRMGGGDQ